MTLADVARQASVSVATVSRALAGNSQISDATKASVRQVANDLGYVPNVAARSLVMQSSATFGVMTPDVTDPIHGQFVTGFQKHAAELGYSVILANGFGDANNERRAMHEFAAHRVAGLAVMGSVSPHREVKRLLSPSPVLFLGSEYLPRGGAPLDLARGCLRPDERDGMRQVVSHLIERGYRKVAYVSSSSGASHILRRDALVAALAERRRSRPVVLLADDAGGLTAVAERIRRHRPQVVVCYDDKTALNLIDEMRIAGLKIPADVGVVGFDDIAFARISNPRLTTVSQRSDELGRLCVELLRSSLDGKDLPRSGLMPVTLMVRETTPGPVRPRSSSARSRSR